jgi:long-subunit fatty acid transport protein
MRYKIFILILIGLVQNVSGQSVTWPATWFEFGISKKITKSLKLEFTPELRYFEDFKLDSYILEGGIVYKVQKYLSLGTLYRFENEYKVKKDMFSPSHRGEFFAASGFDFNRFKFQLRVLYVNDLGIAPATNNEASYFRYRAKLAYDIKSTDLTTYISTELYHDLIVKEIDKLKYTIGLAYALKKKFEIGLFYRIQQKPIEMTTDHIIGIGCELKL